MPSETEEFDPFATETGFKSDYDGVIEDAWFATSEKGGDNIMFFASIKADDGEEVENRYSCGGDWATYDGGETVEHPKGSRKGFNSQTKYAGLLAAAMTCEGAEGVLRERSMSGPKTDDGIPLGPRSAALWKGTKWHWIAVEKDYDFPDKEKPGERVTGKSITVKPTAFLGVVGDAAAGGTATSTGVPAASSTPGVPAASSTPAATAPSAASTTEVPADLLGPLTAAAKAAPDFNSFIDAAMEISGVPENGDVMGKVADEAFYASLKT